MLFVPAAQEIASSHGIYIRIFKINFNKKNRRCKGKIIILKMYITWQIVFSAASSFSLTGCAVCSLCTLFVVHAVKTIKITTSINLQTLEHVLSCRGLTQPFPLPKQFYCWFASPAMRTWSFMKFTWGSNFNRDVQGQVTR